MGELLFCRGADPFALPASVEATSPPFSFQRPSAVVVRASLLSGKNCSRNARSLKRRALSSHGKVLNGKNFPQTGICSPFGRTLSTRLAKEKSPSFAGHDIVCNASCRIFKDLRHGFKSSPCTGKQTSHIGAAHGSAVRQRLDAIDREENAHRCYQSSALGSSEYEFRVEHSLASHIHSSVAKKMNLLRLSDHHVEKISVAACATRKPWWKRFLFERLDDSEFDDDDENGDISDDEEELRDVRFRRQDPEELIEDDVDDLLSNDRKFFSWQQRRRTLDEFREYQDNDEDPDSRDWEDWLDDSWGDYSQYTGGNDKGWYSSEAEWEKGGVPRQPPKKPERGMNRTMKEMVLRIFEPQGEVEDDLDFEEKMFRYTTRSTAQFFTALILIPWFIDFVVHDFMVVPFLRRWVEEVPLAAKVLDLKKSQKLHMIERLKLERQRVRFEADIGKAPPLSDEELNEHIHEEAVSLREELRDENRQAFGNIWSDAVAGFTVWMLLIFNPQKVAIMKLTGDRLFTNISDTGKAFIIILGTDIFLGYHSESGWETVIEILLDHYGLEVSLGAVYIFVAIVPVTIDACFKLWVFRYLTRLSPSAAATFREMKRH